MRSMLRRVQERSSTKNMKLQEVQKTLEAEIITGGELLDKEIKMTGGSDLMSDVLAFSKPGGLLLTGLTNPQVVRTAEMAELEAICFVRGKIPEKETIDLARNKKIPLLRTHLSLFASCGRLFEKGMPDCFEYKK
jgi:predicted transcriptional regulator